MVIKTLVIFCQAASIYGVIIAVIMSNKLGGTGESRFFVYLIQSLILWYYYLGVGMVLSLSNLGFQSKYKALAQHRLIIQSNLLLFLCL